ncbi:MAG: succinate dehydrogenase assembly factor 2 [Pseudomonadota bacterium]
MTSPVELKALAWRCRRGMRELDVLLSGWLQSDYAAANSDEKAAFERLLELQDPEIFGLLTGRLDSADPAIQTIVGLLRGGSLK